MLSDLIDMADDRVNIDEKVAKYRFFLYFFYYILIKNIYITKKMNKLTRIPLIFTQKIVFQWKTKVGQFVDNVNIG